MRKFQIWKICSSCQVATLYFAQFSAIVSSYFFTFFLNDRLSSFSLSTGIESFIHVVRPLTTLLFAWFPYLLLRKFNHYLLFLLFFCISFIGLLILGPSLILPESYTTPGMLIAALAFKGVADSLLLPTILLKILQLNQSLYNGLYFDATVVDKTILGFEIVNELGFLFAFQICSVFWINEGFRASCDFVMCICIASGVLYFFAGGPFKQIRLKRRLRVGRITPLSK